MSSYPCDDCEYHAVNGGSCIRYQEECPFEHLIHLPIEHIKITKEALVHVECALNLLKEIDKSRAGYSFEQTCLSVVYSTLEEKISKTIVDEWKTLEKEEWL